MNKPNRPVLRATAMLLLVIGLIPASSLAVLAASPY